jgi:mono/diheme cytochrome c family protein
MKKFNLAIFLLVFALSVSCSKKPSGNLYTPSASDATSTATLADLQQGRDLYINNCGRCHGLYSPDDFTPGRWKSIIPGMAQSTSLTSAQTILVTKYVTRGQ